MRARIWFAIPVFVAMATAVQAEPLLFGRALTSSTCPPVCYNCPDDYGRKPLPCVRRQCGGSPDDYCAKPLPFVPCFTKGCGDDYCPKPFPRCLPPSIRPWYTCGPAAAPCAGCGKMTAASVGQVANLPSEAKASWQPVNQAR